MARKDIFNEYYDEMVKAYEDSNIRLALGRAIQAFRQNFGNAITKYPHTRTLAEEVRKIKEYSLEHWEELIQNAMANAKENKSQTYFAKTEHEMKDLLKELIGSGHTIVKPKSITGEEFEVREYLEHLGNSVWETDLGELILQLIKEKPMHILSPAIHVPRERVADVFSKVMGKQVPPEIALEVEAARQFLRQKYVEADIALSSTNVVAADTGAVFIIENEGNARLATGFPRKHIIIVGIEKVVPTISDAFKVAEVTWRYAQYSIPSYVNIIGGPSKTGDIEKVTTYGAHGPKEVHIIFYDNGRSEMAKHPVYKQAAYCLRCGGCMYECPVFAFTAGRFGYRYFIGYGSVWTAFVAGGWDHAAPIAYTCLRCGRCTEQCPVKIDTVQLIAEIRKDLVK